MIRRLLYTPSVNTALRTVIRPFASMIPRSLRFPIVAPFEVEISPNKKLRIVANETSYVSKVLFWEGIRGYEYHMVPTFLELARSAEVVIDVGANIGYYSLLAAAVNPSSRVLAFEPAPAAHGYLLRNIAENACDNIHAKRLALSDVQGTISFIEARNPRFRHVKDHLTGASGIEDPGEGYVHERPFEVETDTLDSFLERTNPGRVDVLKIDAEASEHLVLRGAERALTTDRPIVFCEALPGRVESEMQAIFDRLAFVLFNARDTGLHEVPELAGPNLISHDFVAVPREGVDAFKKRFVK